MSQKTMIWLGVFIGSTVGGMIPGLWGDGMFSLTGVFLSAIGGFLGIYMGFKVSQ